MHTRLAVAGEWTYFHPSNCTGSCSKPRSVEVTGYWLQWVLEPTCHKFCDPRESLFRIRGTIHGHQLKHRRCHLNIRKHFFTVRVTEHWHRLPKQVVESPSLGDIQKSSGHSPGQPGLGDPAWAVGLDQVTSRGPFQLCDSVIQMIPPSGSWGIRIWPSVVFM